MLKAILDDFQEIYEDSRYTITVYFTGKNNETIKSDIRYRFYSNENVLNEEILLNILNKGFISGKFQHKEKENEDYISKEVMNCSQLIINKSILHHEFNISGKFYFPKFIRVFERKHFISRDNKDHKRLTVDLNRWDYIYDRNTNKLAFIGDLGPKIEIKGTDYQEIKNINKMFNFDDYFYWIPYNSLQLIFMNRLRNSIPIDNKKLPEIETKITIDNHTNGVEFCSKLAEWININGLHVLPYPHMMNRIRKCHIVESKSKKLKGFQLTLMETASGKIALKKKKNPRIMGISYIRDTVSSLTTDIENQSVDMETFLKETQSTLLNSFVKKQYKIPFIYKLNFCYLFTVDICQDRHGNKLNQLEIEFIGRNDGLSPQESDVINGLECLYKKLTLSFPEKLLNISYTSKFDFFKKLSI